MLTKKTETVLRKRVDRLDKPLREILRCASVQGNDFAVEVLAGVLKTDYLELISLLRNELINRHHLVEERGEKTLPNGEGVHEFSFRHKLLRDYVYQGMEKTEQERLHAQVGLCLEELCQPNAGELAELLATHFQVGQVLPKAVAYAVQAAKHANRRYRTAEAVHFAVLGLEALDAGKKSFSFQKYAEYKILLLIEQARAEEYGGDPQELKDHVQAGILLLEENLLLTEQTAEEFQADFYAELGRLYDRKGKRPHEAKSWLENALRLYENCGNRKQIAETCYLLGDINRFVRFYSDGLTPLEHSIAVLWKGLCAAEQMQDAAVQSKLLSRLVWRYGSKDMATAQECAKKSLLLAVSSHSQYAELKALDAMAYIFRRHAKHKRAIKLLQSALAVAQQLGDLLAESILLNNLGVDCRKYADLQDEARSALEESVKIREKIGASKVISFGNLGWIFAQHGQWQEAEACWRAAIEEISEKGASIYKNNIGRIYIHQEKYEQAQLIFIEHLKMLEKYGSSLHCQHLRIARCCIELGDERQGREHMSLAEDLMEKETLSSASRAEYLCSHADLLRGLGELEAAQAACKKSLSWFTAHAEDPDDYLYVARIRLVMGKILVTMQSFQEAASCLEQAKTTCALGKYYALGETMLWLGKAQLGLGHRAQAEHLLISALVELQQLGLHQKEAEVKRLLKSCSSS